MCARARAAGVGAGLSLAQARALCPDLTHADHDPAGDAKALEALARWMTRFSPFVSCSTGYQPSSSSKKKAHEPAAHATGLFLDVTGTQRLFGSFESLLDQIAAALARFGLPARLAVAPTPGAAWALTFAPPPARPIITTDLPAALAPLPPHALRLDGVTLATLHHLGLHTIGQVLALPRDLLPSRFGPLLLERIDQAVGRLPEPLAPLPYHAPIESSVDFDGVVDSLESLWLSFQSLIAQITEQLVRRGLGARQLVVTFRRPYAPPIEKSIELSGPSRNPAILFNLIRCAMETVGKATKRRRHGATKGRTAHVFTLRRPVAEPALRNEGSLRRYEEFSPSGFIGLRLAVPVVERLTEEQILLLEQEEHTGRQELDRLIERLRVRLGEQALVAVEPVECHVPERAYRVRGSGFGVREKIRIKSATRDPGLGTPDASPRPLHLLPTPRELRVIVRPSDDRDGAPVSFALDGRSHRIVHAVGPERIAGAWWLGHDKTRDYFDVEDDTGRRWWVFRVLESFKWYVHGSFD